MTTAKLFMTDGCQAVRLPEEFRFPGKEVRIRRFGTGVLLEPVPVDMSAVFAAISMPSMRRLFRSANSRQFPIEILISVEFTGRVEGA